MSTIRQRGDKWQAIVRVKRDGVIVHQEAKTFDSERLASDWAGRVEERIKSGGVQARQASLTTFGDLIERYRKALTTSRPISRSRQGELDQLSSELGSWKLSSLTSSELVKWSQGRRAAGAGPTTVLHNLSTIRSILSAAKPMFGIECTGAPASDAIAALGRIGAVAPSVWRDRRLKDGEEQALIEEFERVASHPSTFIPMAKLVRLALCWPRRRADLVDRLKWEQLDERRKVAMLLDTKNPRVTRNETVPVPKTAWAIINSMPKVDERVFPFNGESVSAAFDRACDRLGLEDLHFHDLRHEGICRLFEAGLDIPEVCAISGHLSWTTLRRYTHLRPDKVLEKLDARSQEVPQAGNEPA